jgi:hypothetical protein
MEKLLMLKNRFSAALTASLLFFVPTPSPAADVATADSDEIAEITVSARRVANLRPAGTYASPATTLRFDPLTAVACSRTRVSSWAP